VRDGLGIKAPLLDESNGSSEFNIEGANFWQFYDSYIFVETTDGILILDQHAAHERVMYERVIREKVVQQKLLFPILLDLNEVEQKLLQEFRGSFEELGFGIEKFGGDTWRLTAVPSILRDLSSDSFISMLLELAEYRQLNEDKLRQATRVVACKSAIKAGHKLAQEEIKSLVKTLFATGNPYFCPHGRPTIMKFTRSELERKFGK
jgi:DNA mismatch repair protein MutL